MKRIITLALAAAVFAFPCGALACQRNGYPMLLVGSGGNGAIKPVSGVFVGSLPADPFAGSRVATHAIPLTVAIRFSTDFTIHHSAMSLDPPCAQSRPNIMSILLHGIKAIRNATFPH